MDISVNEFLEDMKKIQTNLLDLLEHDDNIEEKFQNLINIFDDNQFKIKPLFYLILKISNNHYRESEFISKIEKILQLFKDDMKKYFTNNELFHIFKSNKRLLLFLFEENMMIMDEYIVKKLTKNYKYIKAKYSQYFQPEIQPFINEKWFPKYDENNPKYKHNKWIKELNREIPEDFYSKRKTGENDNEICQLIQKDLIEEFIIYVNKNCYPVNSEINPSIYETNNFLLKQMKVTLIEYAVFFGSIQIFNYLRQNGAEIKTSICIYAVHGENAEIINFLEENKILPLKKKNKEEEEEEEYDDDDVISFKQLYNESIKCHHIDVANYIQDNYLQNEKQFSNDTLKNCLKYYNFMLLQCDIDNETSFCYLCKYDYYLFVFVILKKIDIDINKKII